MLQEATLEHAPLRQDGAPTLPVAKLSTSQEQLARLAHYFISSFISFTSRNIF